MNVYITYTGMASLLEIEYDGDVSKAFFRNPSTENLLLMLRPLTWKRLCDTIFVAQFLDVVRTDGEKNLKI